MSSKRQGVFRAGRSSAARRPALRPRPKSNPSRPCVVQSIAREPRNESKHDRLIPILAPCCSRLCRVPKGRPRNCPPRWRTDRFALTRALRERRDEHQQAQSAVNVLSNQGRRSMSRCSSLHLHRRSPVQPADPRLARYPNNTEGACRRARSPSADVRSREAKCATAATAHGHRQR